MVANSTATDATVIADYRQTSSPEPVETLLVSETDLAAEAARRLALWKTPRTVFKFDGYAELFDLELGDTITLTSGNIAIGTGGRIGQRGFTRTVTLVNGTPANRTFIAGQRQTADSRQQQRRGRLPC